jgi:hypothetical protein
LVKNERKKLSYETYNIHLRNLRVNGLLEKTGTRFLLSDNAYLLHRLKILEFTRPGRTFLDGTEDETNKEEKQVEHRLKMLYIVSYYGHPNYFYPLDGRQQFEEFLSRHNIREIDLKGREYDIDNKGARTHIKEYRPDPVYGIRTRIVEEIPTGKISYCYFLPGFNVVDIMNAVKKRGQEFYYVNFARSDLQEAIDMMMTEGLLERIGELDNEIRYRFPERLQSFLRQCRELNDDLFSLMMTVFEYVRSPIKAEKKWLEFFHGSQSNSRIEQRLRDFRHNRRFIKRRNKKIRADIRQNMSRFLDDLDHIINDYDHYARNSDSNIKYRLFVQKLLEYVYPEFMADVFHDLNETI